MELWVICLVLACMLLGSAVLLFFTKKLGMMRLIFSVVCCLVAAYVIYIPPFFLSYDFSTAVTGNIINVLQTISLDANCLDYYQLIWASLNGGIMSQIYLAVMVLLHLALPAVFALTAVTLILQCLSQMKLRQMCKGKKDLHIFSEVNDRSVMLATDIRKKNPKCDIVMLEDDNDKDHSGLREHLGCVILNEPIERICPQATQRKVYYYCIGTDEKKNLNGALAILSGVLSWTKDAAKALQDAQDAQEKAEKTQDKKAISHAKRACRKAEKRLKIQQTIHGDAFQKNNIIHLFTQDPQVELMVDSVEKGLVEIDVENEHRSVVYRLLEEHLLTDGAKDGVISVMVCGFSHLAREFVRAASWCGQLDGYHLKIRIVGDVSRDEIAQFRSTYPGLFTNRYDIDFIPCTNRAQLLQTLDGACADAGYIVVAEEDEEKTVDNAVLLRRAFFLKDKAFNNQPLIFAHIENGDKAAAVAKFQTAEFNPAKRVYYNIVPFGVVSQTYTHENITGSVVEKLAKNVHLCYSHIFSTGELDVDAALGEYNLFEVKKQSSRANALHIRYKLAMIGLDYTSSADGQEVDFAQYLTEEVLEKLTVAEHDRWMAFLESEGWITATVAQSDTYRLAGRSGGRHESALLQMHPYICPFEELKERSDGLGKEDATIYDRELIRRIPDLLHDRWNAAGVKYRIVKKNR